MHQCRERRTVLRILARTCLVRAIVMPSNAFGGVFLMVSRNPELTIAYARSRVTAMRELSRQKTYEAAAADELSKREPQP